MERAKFMLSSFDRALINMESNEMKSGESSCDESFPSQLNDSEVKFLVRSRSSGSDLRKDQHEFNCSFGSGFKLPQNSARNALLDQKRQLAIPSFHGSCKSSQLGAPYSP